MDQHALAAYEAFRPQVAQPFRAACYAPFVSMVFDTIGRVRACCANYEYVLGRIGAEQLDDVWSGERIGKLREALRNYDFSLGCSYCYWKIAAAAGRSEATLADSSLVALKYEQLPVDAEGRYWPSHLEFHLSNACNLECVTCHGEFSSLIRARRERQPAYPRAYDNRFFDDLRKYLPHLHEAQFLGGEPFLMREQFRVWEMLIEDRLSPRCHVTTNGTIYNDRVEGVIERLPISINISMDGATREVFERLRVNARFDEFLGNFARFRALLERLGRALGISFSLSRLNWQELIDVLLFAEDQGAFVTVCNVFDPPQFSLYTLPAEELREVVASLERRAAEVAPRLTRNRAVLEHQLLELRNHAAQLGQTDYQTPYQTPHPTEATAPNRLRQLLTRWW